MFFCCLSSLSTFWFFGGLCVYVYTYSEVITSHRYITKYFLRKTWWLIYDTLKIHSWAQDVIWYFLLVDQIFSLLFLCYLRIIGNSEQRKSHLKILWYGENVNIQQRKVSFWFFSVQRRFSVVIYKINYIYQPKKMAFN